MLIRMVSEYCECAAENNMLATDLASRMSDLLALHNSRMSQLLLGAGALSSAGLRTISARNLALGWRSLQLVQVVLPKVRQHFADLLPPRSAGLRQLDQVTFYSLSVVLLP
jgi:vacuolar protein sorting-associated protein 54